MEEARKKHEQAKELQLQLKMQQSIKTSAKPKSKPTILKTNVLSQPTLNARSAMSADRSWLHSLLEHDKVDILDSKYKVWCIGTIINKKQAITIHFDGFSSVYDETISLDDPSTCTKLAKLHTFTPHHQYEADKQRKPCA